MLFHVDITLPVDLWGGSRNVGYPCIITPSVSLHVAKTLRSIDVCSPREVVGELRCRLSARPCMDPAVS